MALAHICTNPVEVNVGESVNINFGVAAEDKPVTAVDVTVPDGFDLREPVAFNGWQATRDGSVVHFTGGTIKAYTCEFFTFSGAAQRQGALRADITVIHDDATTRVYADPNPYSPFPTMGIYAGVPLPSQGVTPLVGDSGGGSGPLLLAGSVAVIAGGVTALFLVSRSWRRPAA